MFKYLKRTIGIAILIVLCMVKLTLTTMNLIIAGWCIYRGQTTDQCNVTLFVLRETDHNHKSHTNDRITTYAALFEALAALLCLTFIFTWPSFNKTNFLKSIFFVGRFYTWGGLLIIFIISNISLRMLNSGEEPRFSAGCIICEVVLTIIFACALNFIDKSFLKRQLGNKALFYFCNCIVLLCAYRNIALFLYDTGMVALSISLISRKRLKNTEKDFTSFVLVLVVALRGSLAQFFFAKLFQGCRFEQVFIFEIKM